MNKNLSIQNLMDEIQKASSDVLIPNNPEVTGTSNSLQKLNLTQYEQDRLETFMSLINNSNIIVEPLTPHCFIEGVYEYQKHYFEVWDEWDAKQEIDVIFVRTITRDKAKEKLVKKINELRNLLQKFDASPKKDISSPMTLEDIETLIKKRIQITTLNKTSGWGALSRRHYALNDVNKFMEANGRYPDRNEMLSMHVMKHHPHLKSGISDLLRNLEKLDGKMKLPLNPNYGITLSKEELLVYESIEAICNDAEKFASPTFFDQDGNGIYKINKQFFVRRTTDLGTNDDIRDRYQHEIMKINEIEAIKIKEAWDAESRDLGELMSTQHESFETTLKEAEMTLLKF